MSNGQAWGNASRIIGHTIRTTLRGVEREVSARTYRASNELRTASLHVLRGQRSGRQYRIPHTRRTYTASAPGEPPAVRTGIFRLSWGTHTRIEKRGGNNYHAIAAIESNVKAGGHLLGDILEHGANSGRRRMAARPYKQAVCDRAMPRIREIYNRPYKV